MGRTRPELYEVFKQLVSVFKALRPQALTKIANVAVTFNPLQYAARTMSHNSPILVSLYEADIDYHLVDLRSGVPAQKISFLFGQSMAGDRRAEDPEALCGGRGP